MFLVFARRAHLLVTLLLTLSVALAFTSTATHAASGTPLGATFPLYVANPANNTIVKLDSTGTQTVFASGVPLDAPYGLAVDQNENVYVSNWNTHAIIKIDSSGTATTFTQGENLRNPAALAFDANGDLYVANMYDLDSSGQSTGGRTITKIDTAGVQTVFAQGQHLSGPTSLAFDAHGNLYVASQFNHKIVKIDGNGVQTLFAQLVAPAGPVGLEFDSAGNLYVANYQSSAVLKLDSTGTQQTFVTQGGLINGPADIAFDTSGNLYIASSNNNRIVKVDTSGAQQTVFAEAGNLAYPFGLTFSPTRSGYVFSGFFAPIETLVPNAAKAGQTIPVKWRITDTAGVPIADPASFVSVTSTTSGACSGAADAVETYSGSSGLQYLGDGYWQYNWKTPKAYTGQCRTMSLNLADGDTTRTASFIFK